MFPIFFTNLMILGLAAAPFILLFALGWRLVRVLEQRKGSSQRISDLAAEVRSLRAQVSIMAAELDDGERTPLPRQTGS